MPRPQQRADRGVAIRHPQREVERAGADQRVRVAEVVPDVQAGHQAGQVAVGVGQPGQLDDDL
ncbi:MAG TPA: hypothetical protein VNO83_20025, partial [Pseudonocardia sp.]|nr:hypothetical protein [Pseudonocardia sp.]